MECLLWEFWWPCYIGTALYITMSAAALCSISVLIFQLQNWKASIIPCGISEWLMPFSIFQKERVITFGYFIIWNNDRWQPLCDQLRLDVSSDVLRTHYNDVIMSMLSSQITSLTVVYSTIYSGTDQRKHQSSASLAFVRGIHRWPLNSPHKGPVTRKMFPFDDVIMSSAILNYVIQC